MYCVDDAVEDCKDECVSLFEGECLETFADEGISIWKENRELSVGDIVDTVFQNNDVDSCNMDEWIDNFCNGIGDSEDIIYDYGIQNALNEYYGCEGNDCGEIASAIVRDAMDYDEHEECIDRMKDSLHSELSDEISHILKLEQEKEERLNNALINLRLVDEKLCDLYDICEKCPLWINSDIGCTIQKLAQQCDEELKRTIALKEEQNVQNNQS